MKVNTRPAKSLLLAALLASLVPSLQGCFPLVATGVAVTVLAATDRRSVGTQTEDEGIEWKASNRVSDKIKSGIHVNITSYNRKVLITGEVPDEATRESVGEIVRGVENVQGIWNELALTSPSSLSNRSTDSYITSKVKARFVDAGGFSPNHVKVVTEAGTVFLLGMVTERESKAAIRTARTTDGVRTVVNLLEVLPDAEIRRIDAALSGKSSESK